MIKKSVFENDLILGMERELSTQNIKQGMLNLDQAAEQLHAAMEIFEQAGLNKQADQILNILNKIAIKHKPRKPKNPSKIKDPFDGSLSSKEQLKNLKEIGWVFRDSNSAEDDNDMDTRYISSSRSRENEEDIFEPKVRDFIPHPSDKPVGAFMSRLSPEERLQVRRDYEAMEEKKRLENEQYSLMGEDPGMLFEDDPTKKDEGPPTEESSDPENVEDVIKQLKDLADKDDCLYVDDNFVDVKPPPKFLADLEYQEYLRLKDRMERQQTINELKEFLAQEEEKEEDGGYNLLDLPD